MGVAGIVLAAGSGERFGAPKQFADVDGRRLVDLAVELVLGTCDLTVLALPPGVVWDGVPVGIVVEGGPTRTETTRRALQRVGVDHEVVVLHDCVRPLATATQVAAVVEAVRGGADAAVSAWEVSDTVKQVQADGSLGHVGREGYVLVQSPMAFRTAMLRRVFSEFDEVPIEETIAVERLGGRVVPVPGDPWSHHVVDPSDLDRFRRLLE